MLHGIELDSSGQPAWFHFGIIRLLHTLAPFGSKPTNLPDWAHRWWTTSYLHDVRKLQDTVWKFDRSAGHVDRCRSSIEKWVKRKARGDTKGVKATDPDYSAFTSAVTDLPLYLDSMLIYLRIQADAFAMLVPYFYERNGVISSRSFRDQMKWFTKTNTKFDPSYATILSDQTDWFEELAGKDPTGLRDAIIHHGGTHQLGWVVPDQETDLELRASIVDRKGFVDEDLIAALIRMTGGWFSFLDLCCQMFREKVAPIVSWAVIDQEEHSRYASLGGTELPSHWVYPRAG